MFTRENITGAEGREEIEKLRNYSAALQVIKTEFKAPSVGFAKFIIHQIDFLTARTDTVTEFQGHLKKIIEHQYRAYFGEQLNKLRGQDIKEEAADTLKKMNLQNQKYPHLV